MTDPASPDDLVHAVWRYAVRVASGDRVLRVRPDVTAEDVAQDVALQFHRMPVKPELWKAWTAQATRHRLIDLAKQRGPAKFLEQELEDRLAGAMGPSAAVIALGQARRALAVLTQTERDVFGEHLLGAANAELAERYGYKSVQVVSSTLTRIGKKIREKCPDLREDLEPQRVYALADRIAGAP